MTWMSIIYLLLNKSSSEKVAVGLLLSNGEQSSCSINYKKAEMALKLVGESGLWRSIKPVLENYVSSLKNDESQVSLFKKPISKNRVLYFNQSLEGTIYFGEPMDIALSYSNKTFEMLNEHYIGLPSKSKPKRGFKGNRLLKKFERIPDIREFAAIRVKVNSTTLPELITPKTIDLVALNGTYLHAHLMDFENWSAESMINHAENALLIHHGFELKAKKESRNSPKMHLYYSNVSTDEGDRIFTELSKLTFEKELIPIENADSVIDILKKGNYKPVEFGN